MTEDHPFACPCSEPECQRKARVISATNGFLRTAADRGVTAELVAKELASEAKRKERNAKIARGEAYPLESHEQKLFADWARANGWKTMTTNNGAHLAGSTGQERARKWGQLRACGASKGSVDIILVHTRIDRLVLWVEMKRQKEAYGKGWEREWKPEQREWNALLVSRGWPAFVAWGFEDAKRQVEEYMRRRAALEAEPRTRHTPPPDPARKGGRDVKRKTAKERRAAAKRALQQGQEPPPERGTEGWRTW